MDSSGYLVPISGHKNFFRDPVSEIIYWRKSINGRPFKKSTGFKKITEAKKFVDDFLISITASNIDAGEREKKGIVNPPISLLWAECLNARRVTSRKSTEIRWRTAWDNDLGPFWGKLHLSDFNEDAVKNYESWFLKNKPGKYFFTASKYLKMLINYCHKRNYIREKYTVKNLDKIIPDIARRKKPFRVYTKDEQASLIEHAVNERARLALILYFDTGARKMEILKIKVEQINFTKRYVELWSDKNKKWRKVPLTNRAYDALHAAAGELGGEEFLFPMKRDPKRFMAGQVFDKDWTDTKKAAQIKGRARVHDTRHTFASKTADDKWPVRVACDVLDMTPNVYLTTYVHTSWEDIVESHMRSFDV